VNTLDSDDDNITGLKKWIKGFSESSYIGCVLFPYFGTDYIPPFEKVYHKKKLKAWTVYNLERHLVGFKHHTMTIKSFKNMTT
jgi:hypothetical protein